MRCLLDEPLPLLFQVMSWYRSREASIKTSHCNNEAPGLSLCISKFNMSKICHGRKTETQHSVLCGSTNRRICDKTELWMHNLREYTVFPFEETLLHIHLPQHCMQHLTKKISACTQQNRKLQPTYCFVPSTSEQSGIQHSSRRGNGTDKYLQHPFSFVLFYSIGNLNEWILPNISADIIIGFF